MSLKRNIVSTYASQIYGSLIGIAILPVYINYMGAEAYGLVGFYAMLQAWFQLLDVGLAPTISRETARYRGGAIDGVTLKTLFRALEVIFFSVAIVGSLFLFLLSEKISTDWLNPKDLSLDQVSISVRLMAGIIGFRWLCGLYRGAIGGFEEQEWLAKLNFFVATARFIFVIVVFEYLGSSPAYFFGYQLFIALLETCVLMAKAYRLMPQISGMENYGFSLLPLRRVLRFSLSVAFTSSAWVFITQTDKLFLSKILPLSIYAHFTLAVVVANGVNIITGPISSVLTPRLSRLSAQEDRQGVISLYRHATQFVAVVAATVTLMLAVFAEPILQAWTGSVEIARQAAPVLMLYALGNGILALGAFPYYLQFAKGDLRLHIWGNVLFVCFLLPMSIIGSVNYGGVGAGWAWLLSNALYFLVWVPVVHRKFAPGLHWRWIFNDTAPIVLTSVVLTLLIDFFVPLPEGRALRAFFFLVVSFFVFMGAATASTSVREHLRFRKLK